MKHALFAILFFCPLFAFGDTNDEMAIRDLERAIQMTDATMEHSFSGSTSNMRMYDLYNLETQQGSGTADVWPYTAAIEAHCSVIEAMPASPNGASTGCIVPTPRAQPPSRVLRMSMTTRCGSVVRWCVPTS